MERLRAGTWVVIAAYNEAAMIGTVVSRLFAGGWKQVAVVDDGSRDATAANAAAAGASVLRHVINLGQGAALQTGMREIYAGPEVGVTAGQHFSAKVGADLPVGINNNGFQIVPDYRVHGSLTWSF